jgi:hypothetical protein
MVVSTGTGNHSEDQRITVVSGSAGEVDLSCTPLPQQCIKAKQGRYLDNVCELVRRVVTTTMTTTMTTTTTSPEVERFRCSTNFWLAI